MWTCRDEIIESGRFIQIGIYNVQESDITLERTQSKVTVQVSQYLLGMSFVVRNLFFFCLNSKKLEQDTNLHYMT